MASSAASLGAPVTEPGGKPARTSSAQPTWGRKRPRTVLTRWKSPGWASTAHRAGTSTEPYSHTRPRSLRTRSTIITFSALSLAVNPPGRAAVPLTGLDSTTRRWRRRKSSGDADATNTPAPGSTTVAARGAGGPWAGTAPSSRRADPAPHPRHTFHGPSLVATEVSPRRPTRGSVAGAGLSGGVEPEHADGVAPHDELDAVVVEPLHLLLGDLAGVGPGAVGVGVVALVGHPFDTDVLQRPQPVGVAEEAPVHVAPEQLAGSVEDLVGHAAPGPVLLPHHVGPLQHIGDPADLAFRVGDDEPGEAGEHTRHEPVHQGVGGVGEGQGRAHRGRGVGRGGGHLRAGADVHADDRPRLLASAEEGIPEPARVVDRGQAQEGGDLAEADGPHSPARVAAHLGGGQVRVP